MKLFLFLNESMLNVKFHVISTWAWFTNKFLKRTLNVSSDVDFIYTQTQTIIAPCVAPNGGCCINVSFTYTKLDKYIKHNTNMSFCRLPAVLQTFKVRQCWWERWSYWLLWTQQSVLEESDDTAWSLNQCHQWESGITGALLVERSLRHVWNVCVCVCPLCNQSLCLWILVSQGLVGPQLWLWHTAGQRS